MSAHHVDVRKHVRTYLIVLGALAVGTLLTVLVAKVHLAFSAAIAVAFLIAIFKGSLVASFFMHLVSERRLIYVLLIFTAFFLASMVALMLASHSEQNQTEEGHGAFSVHSQSTTARADEHGEK
jgi:caa(3)-type oxidase subunit IV